MRDAKQEQSAALMGAAITEPSDRLVSSAAREGADTRIMEPLADLYRDLSLPPPAGRIVPPLALPPERRRRLVHASGMTRMLEASYGQTIALNVLRTIRHGALVTRQILLLLQDSGIAVEMALIRIHLECLPPSASHLVLDEALPLGTILRRCGIAPVYHPSLYFAVMADASLREYLAAGASEPLYGRRVLISDTSGCPVADAIEIEIPAS